ncbi:MAG: PIN domain-containing protein, partial [Candidatus Acidiferrales bacterium]
MDRTTTSSTQASPPTTSETVHRKPSTLARPGEDRVGSVWDMLIVRGTFALVCVAAGYHFHPFGLSPRMAAVTGFIFSIAVILFELRLRRASLRRLIGAATGSILGIFGAYLTSLVLSHTSLPESERSFLGLAIFLVMTYIGLILGANKGDMLNLQALGGLFGSERSSKRVFKVLDTSVIIDGRVADIAEANFIDGTLVIPQFVLRELQMVADSADPLKRQRGRRGLEVLQRIQKMAHLDVQ